MTFHKIQAKIAATWWLNLLKSNEKIDSLDFLNLPLTFNSEQEKEFLTHLENSIWQACEENSTAISVRVTYTQFIKPALTLIGLNTSLNTSEKIQLSDDDDLEPLNIEIPEYMKSNQEADTPCASLLSNGKVSYRIGKTIGGLYQPPNAMYFQPNYVSEKYKSLIKEIENKKEYSL